ncbi:MAG TPA: hypothetical protein DDW65_15555 [Firmicutes bacterium]|nr:hypothetical protein [Bacillota bacterium]
MRNFAGLNFSVIIGWSYIYQIPLAQEHQLFSGSFTFYYTILTLFIINYTILYPVVNSNLL